MKARDGESHRVGHVASEPRTSDFTELKNHPLDLLFRGMPIARQTLFHRRGGQRADLDSSESGGKVEDSPKMRHLESGPREALTGEDLFND